MRSSTSSFRPSRQRWLIAWAMSVLVAAMVVGTAEAMWRARGWQPNIRDSAQLWSIQRDRVYATDKTPLVLLGASRIEFGVDMKLLAQLLPHYRPVMLAQNAHYPLAALRDLANDERFHGVVLCDVESGGLYKLFADMQQPLVDYYHRQWAPSWHVHRVLLTLWQRVAVVANPDLGAVASTLRVIDRKPPPRPEYFHFRSDRSGDIDYTRTDIAAAKRHFREALLSGGSEMHALVAPEQWRADLDDVYKWTKRIRARGGEVIFYQSPTGPTLQQIEAIRHPAAQYWDRFAADAPGPVLNAIDEPTLAAFNLPDESHLDFRDKPAYTRALADVLVRRGWLSR